MLIICSIAVAAIFLLLAIESILLTIGRKRFALVIHVNGTRGKSTVTRMIHALLREQGMEVFGKTTGSAACLLFPDGSEKPVRRFGPANVREQRNLLLYCAYLAGRTFKEKKKQSALVFECNAIQEELQQISMKWLKPDITIVTNVREDHVRELGNSKQTALSFASAVPEKSVLITAESVYNYIWETAEKQKKLTLLFFDSCETGKTGLEANTACALKAAEYLGIDKLKAEESIRKYTPDAGEFRIYSWETSNCSVYFADARAANDIESTKNLSSPFIENIKTGAEVKRILLLISREDRPDRTHQFMEYILDINRNSYFDQYLCLGYSPLKFGRKLKKAGINHKKLGYITELDNILEDISEKMVYILAVGNFCGPGNQITDWLEARKNEKDHKQIPETTLLKELQGES